MAYIEYYNSNSPKSYIQVWINASRAGQNVTLDAEVHCNFMYSNGYLAYDGEINFNMWINDAISTSANIKGYSDRWYASSEMTRIRNCSLTFADTGGGVTVGCNVIAPAGRVAMEMPTQATFVSYSSFSSPSAPTWFNINPNPCSINSAPTLYWGGAQPGSLGTLYYDIEVASSTPTGWTDWLRISNAQTSTSYQEVVLRQMDVYGIKPYNGVIYQYRVRSSDGSYSTSGWVYFTLNVSFLSPTPPTTISWNKQSVRLSATVRNEDRVTLSYSGATGGAGDIKYYFFNYKLYSQKTKTWTDWSSQYYSTTTSRNFYFPTDFNEFGIDFSNNDIIRMRVFVQNSWGTNSSYNLAPDLLIRGNQVWIKIDDIYVQGDVFFKENNVYVEGMPFIKDNGTWKESS